MIRLIAKRLHTINTLLLTIDKKEFSQKGNFNGDIEKPVCNHSLQYWKRQVSLIPMVSCPTSRS